MDVDRWRRVEQLLDQALGREPAQWPSLLDESCSGDPDLRREVEALLSRLDTARGYLSSPPAAVAAAVLAEGCESDIPTQDGRRIGAYRLIREIGRGGMSRVFLAERADGHYEQQVALKLMRPGLDSELDRERFRTERQILATLSHPNIARLLDGGVTDDGCPYLVLEFVDGESIDRFCDQRSLSLVQRLELFLTVLDATQYAHRNLVIHRDLKPSNILVSSAGQVKLLDFGIAKLLDSHSSPADPVVTRTAVVAMTPEYAAPEQVRGEPVGTATDVYALGMVLYQLLTGRRPYEVRGRSPADIQRIVCEEEPAQPSSACGTGGAESMRSLRGDLDAIVLQALRKEPSSRYGSAEPLARDIERYLHGRPVMARRGSRRYRLGKLVRRHRVETIAAVGIALSLLAGAGISLVQARRAASERDRAEAASRESIAASQESAAVTSFLLGLFEVQDPAETRGDTLTARELLRRGVERVEQLGSQPAAQARLLEVTGRAYQLLGQYPESHSLLERALALRRSAAGEDGLEIAGTLNHLAQALLSLGRYAAADSAARQALAIQERALGPGDAASAGTLHQIGNLAIYRGDLGTAENYHRRGLAVRLRALGAEDSLTALSHLFVGSTFRRQGQLAEAEREYRRALATFERVLGPYHAEVAGALLQVAYLLDQDHGRYAEAEPLYRRALEIRRRAFGAGHPMVAYTLGDLSSSLTRRGEHAAAVPLAREHFEILLRSLPPEHPVIVTATANLAGTLHRAGALKEAEVLYRRALLLDRRIRGPDHAIVVGHQMGLARLLIDRGDFGSSEQLLRDAIRMSERVSGPEHPNTASAHGLLGVLLTQKGEHSAADSVLRRAIITIERQVGRAHQDVRQLYAWLADLYVAWGRPEEAAPYRAIASGREPHEGMAIR